MSEEKLNISLSKFLQKHRITSDGKGMTLAELCYMYEPWILEEIKHIELSEKATDIYLEQAEIEIERLNNDIKVLLKEDENKEKVIKAQDNIIKEVREYIEYQLENLDFEEDTKAKMLGAMVLVLLDKENDNEK